jgi:hypothetical protein
MGLEPSHPTEPVGGCVLCWRVPKAATRRRGIQSPESFALRSRRERPSGRTTEQPDELAALDHSITSSARSRNDSGIAERAMTRFLSFHWQAIKEAGRGLRGGCE